MQRALLEEIRSQVLPLLTDKQIELVQLLLTRGRGRSILKFLVDKSGGITLDECAQLNQEIGRLLTRQNIIQESYVLEVSSPGLDRPLVSTSDFQRAQGKLVRIVLHRPINGDNVWKGFLEKVDEQNVIIRTEKGENLQIAREDIARAQREVQV